MRRVAVVLAGLALVVAGCTSGGGAKADLDAADLRPEAARITDAYAKNQWFVVSARLDANMKERFTEEMMASAWKQVLELKGAYKGRGESKQVRPGVEYFVFDTPMHFERGEMKSRVSFDDEGKIVGFYILLPNVP